MILLKILLAITAIAILVILGICAGAWLGWLATGILIGITEGEEGLKQYDKMTEKEKEEFKKMFRKKK